ncbi:cation transporting ATPase C-terminal domain-containing protein [Legionella longbeachae]|uniref:cation transporting ATPase C-terminal domain-containing protein n=1 Tax=Legionella longbeachae TaxID=450 RepID=UPI0039EF9778
MPIQILWINLVTDSATAISLAVELAESDVMEQPPRHINQSIINLKSILLLGLFGSYIAIVSFFIYQYLCWFIISVVLFYANVRYKNEDDSINYPRLINFFSNWKI